MLKRIITIVVMVCMALFITGCRNPVQTFRDWLDGHDAAVETPGTGAQPDEAGDYGINDDARAGLRDTLLYYRDSDGYLVPVPVSMEWEEGIARAAIMKLIADDKTSEIAQRAGLYSAIPEGTKVMGLTIRDGLAKVDLSAEALRYNTEKEEELMLKSIIYTLSEFNTVDRVQFMFDGNVVQELKFGSDTYKPLEREGINAFGKGTGAEAVVYFQHTNEKGYEYYVPVAVGTDIADMDMGIAIECLLKGPPKGSGLQSSIPHNAVLKGMGTKNGIAYLNFEKGIFDYEGGDSTAESIVKAIALTLKEYPAVTGVIFLVEGQPATLPNGIVLENVIDVPVFANEYD